MPELTKITVNLIPAAADALQNAADRDRLSRTDIMNRALQVYDFVSTQLAGGKTLGLVDPKTGAVAEVRIV